MGRQIKVWGNNDLVWQVSAWENWSDHGIISVSDNIHSLILKNYF
jgi:hypothetical protein